MFGQSLLSLSFVWSLTTMTDENTISRQTSYVQGSSCTTRGPVFVAARQGLSRVLDSRVQSDGMDSTVNCCT